MFLIKCDVAACETTAPVDNFAMPDGWAVIRTARRLTDTERAAAIKKLNTTVPDLPMMSGSPYIQATAILVEEKLYRVCPACRETLPTMKPNSGEDIYPELPMGLQRRI